MIYGEESWSPSVHFAPAHPSISESKQEAAPVDIDWPGLEKAFARDDLLRTHDPHCPQCREQMQIQLISKIKPAEWKCRMCKFRFYLEPKKSRGAAMAIEPHVLQFMQNLARWQGVASSSDLGPQISQKENSARQTARRRGWVTYDNRYWRMTDTGRKALYSETPKED